MLGRPEDVTVAYVSPYLNSVNGFTAILQADLESIGMKVRPLSKSIFSDWFRSRRSKVLVLNWFEDRLSSSPRPWLELTRSLVVLLAARARVGRVIWVRHNKQPHRGYGGKFLYRIMLFVLRNVSDAIVTLRPSILGTHVIPHPNYPIADNDQACLTTHTADGFLLFGTVRRNRGYIELLEWWPQDKSLKILGKCDDPDFIQKIEEVVIRRHLSVQWSNEFVPQPDLETEIRICRCVIVLHKDETSIVSGTFFHAASLGANILVETGGFERYLTQQYSFVRPLSALSLSSPPFVSREIIKAEIEALNGTIARSNAWYLLMSELGIKYIK